MVHGCFKGVLRKLLFHESLESVTRKIEKCFEGVSRAFHRSLKMFHASFKDRKFQGCKDVSRVFGGIFNVS